MIESYIGTELIGERSLSCIGTGVWQDDIADFANLVLSSRFTVYDMNAGQLLLCYVILAERGLLLRTAEMSPFPTNVFEIIYH